MSSAEAFAFTIKRDPLMSVHFIAHVIEFDKLILMWQSQSDPDRIRYIVGEITRNGDQANLRYLKASSDFKSALALGFDGYPAFNINEPLHTQGVLDAFMRRLPPSTRGDFRQYLEILRLPPDLEKISDFSLLGYSGARLPSDGFQIVPSFENVTGPCEFLMEPAGFRHISEISLNEIALGSKVDFEEEPDNKKDAKAIRIMIGRNKIGYITRAYLPAFHRWLRDGWKIKAVVERKKDQPGSPTLYLFVTVIPN